MITSQYLIIGLIISIALILNIFITPLLINLSNKHNLFDKIDERKIHTTDISRLGGIGIFTSFLLTIVIYFSLCALFKIDLPQNNNEYNLLLIGLSITIIFTIGILDDFTEIRARYKLYSQILAAIIAIMGGAIITQINIPIFNISLPLNYLSIPITMIWIIGITNAINLIDGLDGLSSGISIFASIAFGIVFLISNQYLSAIICFTITGSLIGYLFYNFPPARIFMGDSGSLFLGFIFAILPIASFPNSEFSLVIPITMLAIPILDVVAAIWRRVREKRKIFSPDMYHFHHKLLKMGLNNRHILAIVYSICIILGIVSILFHFDNYLGMHYILLTWILMISFFIFLHFKKKK